MIRMIQANERLSKRSKLLYLAGPVCQIDWQSELYKLLIDKRMPGGWDVLNPRPEKKMKNIEKIVNWQYNSQIFSDMLSFWFPKDQDPHCSMFDLGRWTAYEKPIFVAVENGFKYKEIIAQNLSNTNKELEISNSLEMLAEQIVKKASVFVTNSD